MNKKSGNRLDVVSIRRDLHAHPETGFLEYRTASRVASTLKELGWQISAGPEVMRADAMMGRPSLPRIEAAQKYAAENGASPEWVSRMPDGQTGIVADMKRGEGPVVAFRFDMDALPVLEAAEDIHKPAAGGFRSLRDGAMHACAHDGHTAIGMCVGERIALSDSWQGTVRLVFQPAEEGGRGAYPMVKAGVFENVDYFFAAHLGCNVPSGTIAAQISGHLFSKKFNVSLRGVAAHAASAPERGRNALLAGAAMVVALHGIVSPAKARTVLNVGKMVAGTTRNVVADSCELELEVRGDSEESLAYISRRMEEIIAGIASAYGVEFSLELVGHTIGASADAGAIEIVARAAHATKAVQSVLPNWVSGGSEDATFMMRAVQERGGVAAYFGIGSNIPAPHHAANFDIDERSLAMGVDVFVNIAEQLLSREPDNAREPVT